MENLPEPIVDDAYIAAWIDARLNGARNVFIRRVSAGRPNPSKPGEYPATDTGRLVSSVHHPIMVGAREGSLRSDLEYAEYLTTGTVHMKPRRMLAAALDEEMAARPATDQLARAARWDPSHV